MGQLRPTAMFSKPLIPTREDLSLLRAEAQESKASSARTGLLTQQQTEIGAQRASSVKSARSRQSPRGARPDRERQLVEQATRTAKGELTGSSRQLRRTRGRGSRLEARAAHGRSHGAKSSSASSDALVSERAASCRTELERALANVKQTLQGRRLDQRKPVLFP